MALSVVHVLSAPDTVTPPSWRSQVAMRGDGQIAVSTADAQRILLFDSTGRFVRQFGGPGRGPGEFSRIAGLAYAGESLYVFEAQRFHVFDGQQRLVRTVPLPGGYRQAKVLAGGSVVLNSRIGTPAAAGFPFHLLRADGSIVRSFGAADREVVDPRCTTCTLLLGDGLADNQVSAIPPNRYEFTPWTIGGVAAPKVQVSSPWFREWTETGNWIAGQAPRPTSILQIARDGANRLWVRGVQAKPNWQPRLVDTAAMQVDKSGITIKTRGGMDALAEDLAREIQTVIEIIDIPRRAVLARAVVDGAIGLLDVPTAYRFRSTPSGEVVVEILRFHLVTHRPPRVQ